MMTRLRNILLDVVWRRRGLGEFWDLVEPERNYAVCGENILAACC